MKIKPVKLEGEYVRLEPMKLEHLNALCEVGLDGSLWEWIPTKVLTRADMLGYIETALSEQVRGVSLPFVTIHKELNKIVGSTRFGSIVPEHKRVEIGWTWINPAWQRSAVNTEAKLLMLTHAFEAWKCNRVELKTDALNERSRNAILRLGATQEGIFRRHMVTSTGRLRDTAYFSILDDEWPSVKADLTSKLTNASVARP